MPQLKDPESYRKNCTLCNKPRDVLVRCQIDPKTPIPAPAPKSTSASTSTSPSDPENDSNDTKTTTPRPPQLKPGAWHFVCPGSCWQRVSGGVIDGDLAEGRQGYRGSWGREGGRKDGGKKEGETGGVGGGEGRGEYGRKEVVGNEDGDDGLDDED
ncbi:hypothetical protein Q7P36_006005 [Cladosporium allicinum]